LWPDRIESEHDDFFERVREAFRKRAAAQAQRFRIIDAAQSPAGVAASVTKAVSQWLDAQA
jgi:dTMP kinase